MQEPSRNITVLSDVDVLVLGGGPAGVSAAVAAARAGAKTFLIERHGFLGGMWTAGMVLTLAGYNSWLKPYSRCVRGVPEEWVVRATALGGAEDNESFVLNSDPETMKLVADQLLAEAGVQVLFHTWAAHPIMEGNCVGGAFIENVDGRLAIRAKVSIDCTGNGDMMARAGAKWLKGQALQPMTMPFRIGNVVLDRVESVLKPMQIPIGPEPIMLREPLLSQYASRRRNVVFDGAAMHAARARGELPRFGGPWFGGLEEDIVWVNSTRVTGDASVASELTRAEIEGRHDTAQLVAYFQQHFPGFDKSRLLHTSTQIGVRETRRLEGEYTLTGDDIRNRSSFDDGIALGCWPIDVHPSEAEVGVHAMYVPLPYAIPYRCLLPTNVDGLLVAGRCISVDRDALGSSRVGATCAAIGQAAGVAAALASRLSVEPRNIQANALKEQLRNQGAVVDYPD